MKTTDKSKNATLDLMKCTRTLGTTLPAEIEHLYRKSQPEIYVPTIGTLARTGICPICGAAIYRRQKLGSTYPANTFGVTYHATPLGVAEITPGTTTTKPQPMTASYQRGNFRAEFSPGLPDTKRNRTIKKLEASFKRPPGPIKPKRDTRKGTRAERITRGALDALKLYGTPKAARVKIQAMHPTPDSELAMTLRALQPIELEQPIEPGTAFAIAAAERGLTNAPRHRHGIRHYRLKTDKADQLETEGWIK